MWEEGKPAQCMYCTSFCTTHTASKTRALIPVNKVRDKKKKKERFIAQTEDTLRDQ